ncbi:hypothetical protein [Amycolatopsis anabasis]|uniref:hypothetical protein n=1 Tax=Amycolatopsis anabasis TaxID=1840409 RepID=UPI00131C9BEE|nr:hypothetical protein [Amycolatopsis anabasis]
MTAPDDAPHFLGFANRGVPAPPPDYPGEPSQFFFEVGRQHAAAVVDELIRQQRSPQFQLPYDLAEAERNFHPEAPFNFGHEHDNNAADYAIGFCDKMASDALYMRDIAELEHVQRIAIRLEYLARNLSANANVPLPEPFAADDLSREQEAERHFTGYAGRSVPIPPWDVLEVDEVAGMYGETGDFFREVGARHATAVIGDLLLQRRSPEFLLSYDFDDTVRNFRPQAPEHYGGEFDFNDRDYVSGFCRELVEEANRMREALEAEREGETYLPSYFRHESERFQGWSIRFRQRRGDLDPDEVLAIADQFDDLARTLSDNARVELPERLKEVDRRLEQEARDRVAVAELTAAIDAYCLHAAMPGLREDDGQAVRRDQLAAQVAILDTRNPHLLASLTEDRARVVHGIIPESATRRHLYSWPDPLPPAPAPDELSLRRLADTANELATRLLHPAVGEMSTDDAVDKVRLTDRINELHQQHPTLVDSLPPMQAGLVRDVVNVYAEARENAAQDAAVASTAQGRQRVDGSAADHPRDESPQPRLSPDAALARCLDQHGRFDFGTVRRLLGVNARQVPELMGDLIYWDPAGPTWRTAEEYLSGNVREKLAFATSVNPDAVRGDFTRKIEALSAVLPPELGPDEIQAQLGASWIPASDVRDFVAELLDDPDVVVEREDPELPWHVRPGSRERRLSEAATQQWGTERKNAYRLIESTLNAQPARVSTVDTGHRLDVEGTEQALRKQLEINDRFSTWVWEDPDRTARLTRDYNVTFNSHVQRRFDGSYLSFPGMAPEFLPALHQRDQIAQILASPTSLCTYTDPGERDTTMFAAALALKQRDLVSKPALLVKQGEAHRVAAAGVERFPGSRVLSITGDQMRDPVSRATMVSRCALGDWDAVVIDDAAFSQLPLRPTDHARLLEQDAEKLTSALNSGAEPRRLRRIEQQRDTLLAHAQLLRDTTTGLDDAFFSDTRLDFLLIDQPHWLTKRGQDTGVVGWPSTGAHKAEDLDLKVRLLRESNPERVMAVFTSGTSVNNHSELHALLRLLQPEFLAAAGLERPEEWTRTFVRQHHVVAPTPHAPDGAVHAAPISLINVPELHALWQHTTAPDLARPIVAQISIASNFVPVFNERAGAVEIVPVESIEDKHLRPPADQGPATSDHRHPPGTAGARHAAVTNQTGTGRSR